MALQAPRIETTSNMENYKFPSHAGFPGPFGQDGRYEPLREITALLNQRSTTSRNDVSKNQEEEMKHYKYLIIGGGLAGD